MRERTGYLVVGVLVGFVFGALLGVLFAPASGVRTRMRLVTEARWIAEAMRTAAERAGGVVGTLGDKVDHCLGRDEEAAWRKVNEIREGVQRYTRTHAQQ